MSKFSLRLLAVALVAGVHGTRDIINVKFCKDKDFEIANGMADLCFDVQISDLQTAKRFDCKDIQLRSSPNRWAALPKNGKEYLLGGTQYYLVESSSECLREMRKYLKDNKYSLEDPLELSHSAQVGQIRMWFGNLAPAEPVAPAKPNVVAPAKPNFVAPAKPNVVASAKPNDVVPAKPNDIVPAKPNVVITTSAPTFLPYIASGDVLDFCKGKDFKIAGGKADLCFDVQIPEFRNRTRFDCKNIQLRDSPNKFNAFGKYGKAYPIGGTQYYLVESSSECLQAMRKYLKDNKYSFEDPLEISHDKTYGLWESLNMWPGLVKLSQNFASMNAISLWVIVSVVFAAFI